MADVYFKDCVTSSGIKYRFAPSDHILKFITDLTVVYLSIDSTRTRRGIFTTPHISTREVTHYVYRDFTKEEIISGIESLSRHGGLEGLLMMFKSEYQKLRSNNASLHG